jgi:hypothetical protein
MQFVITVGQLDAAKLNVPAEIFTPFGLNQPQKPLFYF